MSIDTARVAEARRRLRESSASGHLDDPALRVVSLDSPREGEAALELHRGLAIVNALDDAARLAVSATLDGLRTRNPNMGLTGHAEVRGVRQRLHPVRLPITRAGSGVDTTPPLFPTAEGALFAEVADTIERAVVLTAAELRGADAAAEELSAELSDTTAAIVADIPHRTASGDSKHELVAMIDQITMPPDVVADLHAALDVMAHDPQRIQLQGAVEQAKAARSQVLPGDGNQTILLADLALAEADGSLAAFDMAPGGPAEVLHRRLGDVGLATSPAEAPEIARRALEENEQLERMKREIVESTPALTAGDTSGIDLLDATDDTPDDDSVFAELRAIDDFRLRTQRRLRSQQQLLAIARRTVHELAGRPAPRAGDEDRFPILLEEPLLDLPGRLSGAVLSMLLRHSTDRQIIVVSDEPALEKWSHSVGERAGWTRAHGWFSGRR